MIKKIYLHFWRNIVYFFVNNIFDGPNPRYFILKRTLLRSIGFTIGSNTKIVAPIYSSGTLVIGDNCWIGANFLVRGNGSVILADNIDVGPDTTYLTGNHLIGDKQRRAGQGYNTVIKISNGCWLGGKSTYVNNITIGESSVVAAAACVCKDVPANSLVGGIPARTIRVLE